MHRLEQLLKRLKVRKLKPFSRHQENGFLFKQKNLPSLKGFNSNNMKKNYFKSL
jgi:hypothetical protein